MTLIKFSGGPQDGTTRELPVTTGEPITFKRESGAVEYEWSGQTVPGSGARLYRVKADKPVTPHSEWPEAEVKPAKPAKRAAAKKAAPIAQAVADAELDKAEKKSGASTRKASAVKKAVTPRVARDKDAEKANLKAAFQS